MLKSGVFTLDVKLGFRNGQTDVTSCFAHISADFLTRSTENGARRLVFLVLDFNVFRVSEQFVI